MIPDECDEYLANIGTLLEEYRLHVDGDMASFIDHYFKSLLLDFELAVTRGEVKHMLLVVSMIQELVEEAQSRVAEAKGGHLTPMRQHGDADGMIRSPS